MPIFFFCQNEWMFFSLMKCAILNGYIDENVHMHMAKEYSTASEKLSLRTFKVSIVLSQAPHGLKQTMFCNLNNNLFTVLEYAEILQARAVKKAVAYPVRHMANILIITEKCLFNDVIESCLHAYTFSTTLEKKNLHCGIKIFLTLIELSKTAKHYINIEPV